MPDSPPEPNAPSVPAVPAGETSDDAAKAEAEPRIVFEHRLFKINKDLYFRVSESQTHVPIMMFNSGEMQLALPVSGIRHEFEIPDGSPDGQMLETVVRALDFVAMIRPGDPVPRELVTGDVSWEIAERHKLIARQRLMVQLISWHAGDEVVITDQHRLQEMTDDPQTKARVEAAYAEAVAQLGYDGVRQVVAAVGKLSDALAAIEALRERYGRVVKVEEAVQHLRGRYTSNMSIFEVVDRVSRLAAIAVDALGRRLAAIDARSNAILPLIEGIDKERKAIALARDDLHRRLAAWEELFELWQNAEKAPQAIEAEVWYQTYRFLAPRFMPVDEWVLLSGLGGQPETMASAVVW